MDTSEDLPAPRVGGDVPSASVTRQASPAGSDSGGDDPLPKRQKASAGHFKATPAAKGGGETARRAALKERVLLKMQKSVESTRPDGEHKKTCV